MKRVLITILAVMMVIFLFDSCKKKVETEPVEKVEKVEETTTKIEKPKLTEEELLLQKSLDQINKEGHLKKINFDFDKYTIREDMKGILHNNADWLLKHKTIGISIDGHCDERGTVEYNMALGEKRAEAAKKYLVSLGITEDRIKIVSYGKTNPVVKGVDEKTHFMNRRDEFVIIKK
ncbi:MAG: OmpA family protein [Acidobacteriota bacterium]